MNQEISTICVSCGAVNRGEAKFCQKCGAVVEPASQVPARAERHSLLGDIAYEMRGMANDAQEAVRSLTRALWGKNPPVEESKKSQVTQRTAASQGRPVPPQPVGQAQIGQATAGASPALKDSVTASTRLISQLIAPKRVGDVVGGYIILEVWPLQHSNYYRVRMERCPQGHANPGVQAERCTTCQAELSVFLMRETTGGPRPLEESGVGQEQPGRTVPVDKQRTTSLIQLSRSGGAGFLSQAAVFDLAGRRYSVSELPPGQDWQILPQIALPVTDNLALTNWLVNLGQALVKLSEAGFTPGAASLADMLEPILVFGPQAAFADLNVFSIPAAPGRSTVLPTVSATPGERDALAFLAQLVYTLASGKQQNRHRAPRDYSDVPPPFRAIVAHVDQNGYPDLKALLDALRQLQKLPTSGPMPARSLRQIAGYSTDNGKKRDHNEDFVGKYSLGMQQSADAPEVGLYLVADGMGGHQAGELASREVVRVILNEIQESIQELQKVPKLKRSTIKLDQVVSLTDVLKQAVSRANEILHNARKQIGSDRGTTLTAALVVGDLCAVANVGDSRTYLWRDGILKQITQDHSLVASLLAANMIQPDEVRSHPQRNQIYRTLGEHPAVEVDVHEHPLRMGDRLILCSDGLWEMVLDQEIQQILIQSSNPQEACDRLIEAANLAGGEDNISVVSVWMA
jgi:serine/threonine protein phosphatase PrpC